MSVAYSSGEGSYSSQEVYDILRKDNRHTASLFLADENEAKAEQMMGMILTIVAVAVSILVISFAALLGAFGHHSQIGLLVSTITMISGGSSAMIGVVMFAIATCKKRHLVNERFSPDEINRIAGKKLI